MLSLSRGVVDKDALPFYPINVVDARAVAPKCALARPRPEVLREEVDAALLLGAAITDTRKDRVRAHPLAIYSLLGIKACRPRWRGAPNPRVGYEKCAPSFTMKAATALPGRMCHSGSPVPRERLASFDSLQASPYVLHRGALCSMAPIRDSLIFPTPKSVRLNLHRLALSVRLDGYPANPPSTLHCKSKVKCLRETNVPVGLLCWCGLHFKEI